MNSTNSSLIDLFFVAELVEAKLYGEPKEGLSEAINERVSNVTGESLKEAARQIISTRKAGSFPTVPDCVTFICAAKRNSFENRTDYSGAITKKNYFERALSASRRNGFQAIYRDIHVEQWAQWCAYFEKLDLKYSAYSMRSMQASAMTVPSLWPSTFDLTYVPPATKAAA